MSLTFKRKKSKHLLLSIIYRLSKLPFASHKRKYKLFLDLTWIFERLSHSYSMLEYKPTDHPGRIGTIQFLSKYLSNEFVVLDLGCSSGDLTKIISSKVKRVDGIDHNLNAIKQAKIKYSENNISFIYGNALEYLKKLNNKYDIIIMSHLLEHIDNPELFLKEYMQFTSYFYIEVPDFEKTYHNIYRKDVGTKLIYTDDDHIFEFDRDDIEKIFNKLNLTIIAKEFRFGVMRFFLKTNN